jgi:hypothetical protein
MLDLCGGIFENLDDENDGSAADIPGLKMKKVTYS